MSLIKNLIKEPEKKPHKSKSPALDCEDDDNESSEKQNKLRPVIKSATDLQRLRLEKLMKNPAKPVIIPEPRKDKDYMQTVPTFVRNVMGSSAGAGSGEFHVYRHLRRKEYARQKTIQAKSMKEHQDEEYQRTLEMNRRAAEEKTAKKRAKRLKKKLRAKRQRKDKSAHRQNEKSDSDNDDDDQSGSEEKNKTEVVVNKTDEMQTNTNEEDELMQNKKTTEERAITESDNQISNDVKYEENHCIGDHRKHILCATCASKASQVGKASNKNKSKENNNMAETARQPAVEEETKPTNSANAGRNEEISVPDEP